MNFILNFLAGYFSIIVNVVGLFFPKFSANAFRFEGVEGTDDQLNTLLVKVNMYNIVLVTLLALVLIYVTSYSLMMNMLIAFNVASAISGLNCAFEELELE